MISYLKSCHTKYQNLFSENWFNNIVDELNEKKLFFEILDFEKDCFILLSKSILSGEYISNVNFEEDLKAFIETTQTEWDGSPTKLKEKYLIVSRCISAILQQYSGFCFYAYDKFITDSSESRMNFYQKSDVGDSAISLVKDVMKVCEYDYEYPLSDKKLIEFLALYLNIKDNVDSGGDSDISFIWEVLLYKCNFIIKRINRKIDFSLLFEINRITPIALDLGPLDKLIKKQISFYPLTDEETLILQNNIKSDNPDLESFIRLSWSIAKKKNSKDTPLMKEIVAVFENKYLYPKNSYSYKQYDPKQSFDKFSINSVYNFIQNCQFSLQLSYKPFDLKSITNHTKRIFNVQKGTLINNFYPFKKGIDSIIKFIEAKLLNYEQNDIFEFEAEIFITLDNLIDKFEEYISWGVNHRFFPFQLAFDESLVECRDLKLFIPSSFANIIDYKSLENDLQEYKNQRHLLAIKYETFKSKLAINELNNQFKKDRFNMLQTIILFAGIITFLFGSINIFSHNSDQNLMQLIVNTSGLGIILVLFTSVSMTIAPIMSNMINFNHIIKSRRFLISSFLIVSYAVIIFLNYKAVQDLNTTQKAQQLESLIRKSTDENIHLIETDSIFLFRIEK